MIIDSLHIENFRGIESIKLSKFASASVIVGQNASGKSTILEAIRLAKSVLAPRFLGEAEQVLTSLGALPPNYQFFGERSIDGPSLLRDVSRPLKIKLDLVLTALEIESLRKALFPLAQSVLRNQLGGRAESQVGFAQYLSSQEGLERLTESRKIVEEYLRKLEGHKRVSLNLEINPQQGLLKGEDMLGQAAVSILEQMQPTHRSLVSYFPADRAFPIGDVTVQIGAADVPNQVQSHLGQAGTKYQRLKQIIGHGILFHQLQQEKIEESFRSILTEMIPGKALKGLHVNQFNALKVMIEESKTGKVFDIDNMSSGEKGILLTFLVLMNTISDGGIVLLDEPELHLNPNVGRKLLPFLIEKILSPKSIQAIICTHSPEVLAAAYERSDCRLFHLRGASDLSPLLRSDRAEVFEALNRLGATTADVLFTKGAIFVEGKDDVEILTEAAFEVVSGFKITERGGRQEVEKAVRELQKAEEKQKLDTLNIFVLDGDRKPLELQSTDKVKIVQWQRYCIENYLIEGDHVYEALKNRASSPPESRAALDSFIERIADEHFRLKVAKDVFLNFSLESPLPRNSDFALADFDKVGERIEARFKSVMDRFNGVRGDSFGREFGIKCHENYSKKRDEWMSKRLYNLDAKDAITRLLTTFKWAGSPLDLKKELVRLMIRDRAPGLAAMKSELSVALPAVSG